MATLITPNLPELRALTGEPDAADIPEQVEALGRKYSCSVLLTGGHHREGDVVRDTLWHEGEQTSFESRWIDLPSSHGTGCTLSAAITAFLARGAPLPEAVREAKAFVTHALQKASRWPARAGEQLVALQQTLAPSSQVHQG